MIAWDLLHRWALMDLAAWVTADDEYAPPWRHFRWWTDPYPVLWGSPRCVAWIEGVLR